MQIIQNLKIIPNFIIINNLFLVLLRVFKFVIDLLSISFFLIIILGLLNNNKVELDLKFEKFELSFVNDLTFYMIIIITFVTFFIKFLLSLLITFSDFKIKFNVYIFTLKLALNKFYLNEIKNIVFKDHSKIYRGLTTEIKFTSIYINAVFSSFANVLILLFSLMGISFLIGSYVFLVLVFLLFCLSRFSVYFSKRLQKYGTERMIFNLQFYNFFHDSIKFIRETKLLNKPKYIIKKLASIKEREWKAGYLAKFLQGATPHIIDLALISLVLIIIYFNKIYLLKENSEIIFVIILMMRTLPYAKELQSNLNEINLYKVSFFSFSSNFMKLKKSSKKMHKILLKKIEFKTKLNNKIINFKINRGEKLLIYDKDASKHEEFLLNFTDTDSQDMSNLYLNNRLHQRKDLIYNIGKVGYCNESPMIFAASIDENITLSSQSLDEKNLKKFRKVCELLNFKNKNRNQYLDKKKLLKKQK